MSSEVVADTSLRGETAIISAVQLGLCPGIGGGELFAGAKTTRHGQSLFLSEVSSLPSSLSGCKEGETKFIWDSSAALTLFECAIEVQGIARGCDRGALKG